MARQKKMTDDMLLNIIKDYLDNNTHVTKIKYSDLVKHSDKMGYENVIYHDFTRNKKVKEFVDIFNEKHDISNYFKTENDDLKKVTFNVDSLVDKNSKDANKLKVLLKVYKKNYDNAFLKIDNLEAEKRTLAEKVKEQEEIIKKLKDDNKKLKNEIKVAKSDDIKESELIDKQFVINGIQYLLEKGNVKITDKNDLTDVLKNLGYVAEDDIMSGKEIEEELGSISDFDITEESNVVDIKSRKTKAGLPDFMR